MKKKYWLIALVIIVFLILAVMGLFGMRQRKRYRGEIFEGSTWLLTWLYLTGKRYISETTPLYQPGDELLIAVQAGQEVKHYDGNAYGTLGAIYIEKIE